VRIQPRTSTSANQEAAGGRRCGRRLAGAVRQHAQRSACWPRWLAMPSARQTCSEVRITPREPRIVGIAPLRPNPGAADDGRRVSAPGMQQQHLTDQRADRPSPAFRGRTGISKPVRPSLATRGNRARVGPPASKSAANDPVVAEVCGAQRWLLLSRPSGRLNQTPALGTDR
jgi:hypothetical protein